MKNMKILFIILLACSQIKSAALESEFVMNIAQSLKASKALAQMVNLDNNPLGKNRDSSYQYDKNSATGKFSQGSQGNQSVSPEQVAQAKAYSDKMAQENNNGKQTTQSNSDKSYDKKSTADKKPGVTPADEKPAVTPADKSTFLSWLNPTHYAAGVDQNNPAVQHLNKIEAAIQDYYDNSVWFGKSTGNTVAQGKAKSEIERLVAEYRKQLDANDKDFVAYKSTFEDMIKDAQSQFSNLKLQEANNPLFTSFSDLLSQLNPFSSKPESADVNNEASKLIQKMEDALAMYYDNTTNVIQKMYQSKDITAAKEQNKSAAMTKFKELAGQYNRYQKSPDFVAKNDEFKALFAQAQEVFGYESSNQTPADSMYTQVSQYMSSFFAPQNKPAAAPQPAAESTFVSWFNPTRYALGVDQNNPAVQHLNKIETAIQDYYDNSKKLGWTGTDQQRQDAKANVEKLVAEYNQKLDAKDKDFVAYKSTFVDMIKDAQSQFSNLNLDPAKEPLFTSFSDLLSKLNPFSSKPESADVNNDASKLMQEMENALVKYYDNTTNVIQKAYQSKEVTAAKELNKSAAIAQFKDLAAQYKANKDDSKFATKNNEFKALFAQAQEVFGYENSSDASQAPADSMYTQVSQYMSSFFAPQNKPAAAPQPAPATPIISKPAPAAPALQQPEPEAAASSSQDDTTERPEQKALNQDQMYRAKMEDAIQQYDENNRNPKEQANALKDFKKAVSDYINNLGQYYSDSYGYHHITAKDDQKKLIQGRADLDKLLQSIKEGKSFGEDNTLDSIEVPLNFYNGIKTESKKVLLRDIQTFINRG